MPTTRSANRPPPKRALSPDSDEEEDDYKVQKKSTRGRGRGGGVRGRGGRGAKNATPGRPPAKRGRKKKQVDSDEEEVNVESDHLHDELKKCLAILVEFGKSAHESFTFPFRKPVDTIALGLTDYLEVVKKPMDLSTMKKKLIGEEYDTAVEFKEDFKLIINNCLLYNNKHDPVAELAVEFRTAFAKKWKEVFPEDDDEFGKNDEEEEEEEEEGEDEEEEEEGDAEKSNDKEATSSEAQPVETPDSAADDVNVKTDESEAEPKKEEPAEPADVQEEADSTTTAIAADSTTDPITDHH